MFASFSNQPAPRNILLIQFGTIKDVVRALPLINILRMRYPFAKITWFATAEMIDFLNNYHLVDRIILAKPGWHKSLNEIKALRKRFRNIAPDICLDLQGNLSSHFATQLSGCPKRRSVNLSNSRIFNKIKGLKQIAKSALQQQLQLLESLGIAGASTDYDLPMIPVEGHTVGWIVRELGLESAPFAILGLGVQSNSTYWETNRYVQVARHLSRELDLPTIVHWQNEQERELAETVVAESDGMVTLAPAISATQFAALARCAKIYVGVDNDSLHIAAAIGIPTIGVFCDAKSRWEAPECENFQWVQAQGTPCRIHFSTSFENDPIQIDNYTYDVIEVCNACDEILRPAMDDLLPERRHEHTSVIGV